MFSTVNRKKNALNLFCLVNILSYPAGQDSHHIYRINNGENILFFLFSQNNPFCCERACIALASQYVKPSHADSSGIHHQQTSKNKFKDGRKSLPHQHPLLNSLCCSPMKKISNFRWKFMEIRSMLLPPPLFKAIYSTQRQSMCGW